MNTKQFLKATVKETGYQYLEIRPHIKCHDGFRMSVQASKFHYCEPRLDLASGEYDAVEIGFPTMAEDLLIEYAECPSKPTETVYGRVPVETVDAVIEKHGGIKCLVDVRTGKEVTL